MSMKLLQFAIIKKLVWFQNYQFCSKMDLCHCLKVLVLMLIHIYRHIKNLAIFESSFGIILLILSSYPDCTRSLIYRYTDRQEHLPNPMHAKDRSHNVAES